MYKDMLGKIISINSVVQLNKHFYTVTGFDSTMTCKVQLSNGYIKSQAAPENLVCIDNIDDIMKR